MSSYGSPPENYLLAVLFVAQSSSEPRLVFHYPPKPGDDNAFFRQLLKDDRTDGSSSSTQEDNSEVEKLANAGSVINGADRRVSPPDFEDIGVATGQNQKKPQWNDVLGQQAGVLAKVLCPSPGYFTRFEVTINGHTFVGRPVYVNQDGLWRKKRRRSSSMSKSHGEKRSTATNLSRTSLPIHRAGNVTSDDTADLDSTDDLRSRTDEDVQSRTTEQKTTERYNVSNRAAEKPAAKDPLTMFHVVYVLSPPPLEHHAVLQTIWVHIAKKFAKALKYEQARSNFVTREASLITSIVKRTKKAHGVLFKPAL